MIKNLFDFGVEKFIEVSLDNRDEFAKPLVFLHVGKTAGSSFREELADRFQPCENVFVDFSKIEFPVSNEKYAAIMANNLADFSGNRLKKCRMVSGHFWYNQIAKHGDMVEGRLITFLRNPVSRLTSSYQYHTSAAHPDRSSFKTEYPTFRHYIQDPKNINGMYRQLTPANFRDGIDAVEWIKKNYYWVGLQENYVASVKLLFAMNGMRFSPHHNIRKSDSDRMNFDVSDIHLAQELNWIDLQIFKDFSECYASMWAEIYHWTDYDRIFGLYLSK